jgi:excisionase family DNA binding protein
MHTLGTAAKAAGVSKSAVYRALKSGKLSGSRTETGDYRIDESELFRWRDAFLSTKRSEPAQKQPETGLTQPETAALQAQIAGLKQIIELMQSQMDQSRMDARRETDDLRQQRDGWQAQAERLALERPKAPPPTVIEMPAPVDRPPRTRRQRLAKFWFGREYRRRAG